MKKILVALLLWVLIVAAAPAGADIAAHFIDVGQADAALIVCGDAAMLIDGGKPADSRLIVAYLLEQGVERLDFVVASHAHEDHVGGLAGALARYPAGTVLAPVDTYDSKAFRDFAKYAERQGGGITIPRAGDVFGLGGATVEVLGPVGQRPSDNDASIVLRITYGDTAFLFTGDMEWDAEHDLLDAGREIGAQVLKVSHHGSDTSTAYRFLREVMPSVAVISVGARNGYGLPAEAVLSRLRDAGVTVYRTDMHGHIVIRSDGAHIEIETQKNASLQTNPTASGTPVETEAAYIGNKNSKKFHRTSCHTLPAEKNRVLFGSREEAVQSGHSPCGNCKP